jgi:hypothetical protein
MTQEEGLQFSQTKSDLESAIAVVETPGNVVSQDENVHAALMAVIQAAKALL